MNKPWDVIAELEADNSRLVKESIVAREAAAGNDEFFQGCQKKQMKMALAYLGTAFLSLLLAWLLAMSPVIQQGIWSKQ
jgi:hypothetical protein